MPRAKYLWIVNVYGKRVKVGKKPPRDRRSRLDIHCPDALKRDLHRIRRSEGSLSLSATACMLLRIGIAGYMALADDSLEVARLKGLLEGVKAESDSGSADHIAC